MQPISNAYHFSWFLMRFILRYNTALNSLRQALFLTLIEYFKLSWPRKTFDHKTLRIKNKALFISYQKPKTDLRNINPSKSYGHAKFWTFKGLYWGSRGSNLKKKVIFVFLRSNYIRQAHFQNFGAKILIFEQCGFIQVFYRYFSLKM